MPGVRQPPTGRFQAFALLALANLLWAGNWVSGRALREAFDPLSLNFWRWTVATLALAPLGLPGLRGKGAVLRQHAGILLFLAATGVAAFQSLVYLGLSTTTTVNAVLLNASLPLFILLCSWVIERERAGARQVAGMVVSFAGILVILSRGEPTALLDLRLRAGDLWILAAMPIWGVYSVMLKRRPVELDPNAFLFVISLLGTLMLLPIAAFLALDSPPRWPGAAAAAGVLYIGIGASVLAFNFWNRGVAAVGANSAGFTIHLLPAFGTVLAIALLGESFAPFHAAGIATIVAGVVLATAKR